MRIFLLTMDSSCFGKTEEDYPEVKKLKTWQDRGWVDLIKTDVLEKESEAIGLRRQIVEEKTKSLSKDYGLYILGHVSNRSWFGPISGNIEKSMEKFMEIYNAVFGEPWQDKADNKTRDALHLHTHLINDRDYFITRDGGILRKKDELDCLGIKVRSPKASIKEIEDYWKKSGVFPPEILTTPKIIAGTCIFEQFLLRTPEDTAIFGVLKQDNFFIFRGTLYSPNGKELIEFSEKPAVKCKKATLYAYASESKNKNRIVLGKQVFACVIANYDGKKFFEARILTKGHLLLQGEFFNERGERKVSAYKKELRVFGPLCL